MKNDLINLLENADEKVCKEIDNACFELVESFGFSPKNKKKCKSAMKKQNLGVTFAYACEEEYIFVWWEMWKYDKNKQIERLANSKKIKIVVGKNGN